MAQVLAVVPQVGLEAVLVAVDLVLEGATPNGSISVEHVRNVLARLNAPETPEQAETALKLTQVPRADTARYDRLRPTHQDGLEVSHACSTPIEKRDVPAELKALRLHGMAGAWAESDGARWWRHASSHRAG